jgi:hypothetical protein
MSLRDGDFPSKQSPVTRKRGLLRNVRSQRHEIVMLSELTVCS